ncbi:DMT family transporter [Novispirillum itersonii]|uniref:DMT family transporter n=1 Tax=Novispirillum itersonii TaxID=189 RepID=UPI0003659AC0|nr:DMT family transporter [Novispirillum itersonii]
MSAAQTPPSSQAAGLLTSPWVMMVIPPLLWAGNAVVGRLAMAQMSPYALSFWRWSFALLLLLPFTLRSTLAHWGVIRANALHLISLGVLSVGAYNTLLYMALQTSTAVNVTLVGAVMPLVILLLSRILLGEALTVWRVAGLAASFFGVAVVLARGDLSRLTALDLHRGDGLMLLAVLAWSVFSVRMKARPLGLPPMVFLTVQMLTGLWVAVGAYLWDLGTGGGQVPMTLEALSMIAYTAIFASLVAFLAWNRGIVRLGANLSGFYVNLIPVFTAVLAVPVLGEPLQAYHFIGMGLIFAGIGLAAVRGKQQKAEGR